MQRREWTEFERLFKDKLLEVIDRYYEEGFNKGSGLAELFKRHVEPTYCCECGKSKEREIIHKQ